MILKASILPAGTKSWYIHWMDEMPQYLYHDAKAGGYYSRLVIPDDVRHHFDGKREFKKRWAVAKWREIESSHLEFIAEKKREIRAARSLIQASDGSPLLSPRERRIRRQAGLQESLTPFASLSAKSDVQNIIKLWFHSRLREERQADMYLLAHHDPDSPEVQGEIEGNEIDTATIRFNGGHQNEDYLKTIQGVADRILSSAGYFVSYDDRNSELYKDAITFTHSALLELLALRRRRLIGEQETSTSPLLYEGVNETLGSPSGLKPVSPAGGVTWTALVEKFISIHGRSVSSKTLSGYRSAIDLANEIFGLDTQVSEITPEMCFDWNDIFPVVPANAKKIYKGKTLREAAEIAISKGLPRRAANTHLTQITRLKTIFNFAIDEGIIQKSPARKLSARAKVAQSGDRNYSIAQINAILESPPFKEFALNKLSHAQKDDCWAILIALFSGARQNEICQLLVSDVKQEDGVDYLDINENASIGKNLKTASSQRKIPIHPALIKIGLLDYVADLKASDEQWLFPIIQKRSNPSDAFSKRYNYFLKRHIGKTEGDRICFHSFRHTFNYWAYKSANAQMDREKIKAILGWQQKEMIDAQYGGQYAIRALFNEIEKLKYPGLRMGHLVKN
ncbi:MAG: site-specific integrase [Alcanivoracaceae bacterium]|nr:site-specific integrase [Alcanivoracaceae bacterium]